MKDRRKVTDLGKSFLELGLGLNGRPICVSRLEGCDRTRCCICRRSSVVFILGRGGFFRLRGQDTSFKAVEFPFYKLLQNSLAQMEMNAPDN